MITVGGAPAGEDFCLSIDLHGERHLHHALAHLHGIAHARIEPHDVDGMVDHVFNAFPKWHALLGVFGIAHGCSVSPVVLGRT